MTFILVAALIGELANFSAEQGWPQRLFQEEQTKNYSKEREASSVLHQGRNLRARGDSTGLLLLKVWPEDQWHEVTC